MQKTPYSSRKASEKTLLEDYAGEVMKGFTSNETHLIASSRNAKKENKSLTQYLAETCFDVAEAMIAEAEKRSQ